MQLWLAFFPVCNLGSKGQILESACCVVSECFHHLEEIKYTIYIQQNTEKRQEQSWAAYLHLGKAGILAGFQQYVRCRGRTGVLATVAVLIVLPDAWGGGPLSVIRVRQLGESLPAGRWLRAVVAFVMPVVGHRWGQQGFRRRHRPAAGIIIFCDLGCRAQHWEKHRQENQAI